MGPLDEAEKVQKREWRWKFLLAYSALFLIVFLLAYSPFLSAGKSFIYKSDGRQQHYPVLVYIGCYLRQIFLDLLHGKVSIPLFDLSLAAGGDVIATLNYYGFGNPLYLLSAFVPVHYTEYLYDALAVARLYLAGLSFCALCSYHKKRPSHTLTGAMVYVFSGYAVFSAVRHPYFIEPMIQLPLLLIGIDLIVRKKRPFVFILSVFYSALCGFYFLYMMTIMLGFYTLVRFFDRYQKDRIREFFAMAGRIVMAYLLGIGMAAPLFVPSVVGFLTSSRVGTAKAEQDLLSWGVEYYGTNLLKTIAPAGSWNALALAAVAALAVVALLLFTPKRCRVLKQLLLASVLVYVFPFGGYVMNGFGYPSQRWTFGAALLLSYIVVEMLPVLLAMDKRQRLICFGAVALYGILVVFYGIVAFLYYPYYQNRAAYNLVGLAMLACTLLVLCLFGGEYAYDRRGRQIGAAVCILLVSANVGVNAIYLFSKSHGNYVGEFTEYGAETKRLETALVRTAVPYSGEKDGRTDSSSFSWNTGTVYHVPTMNTYWSFMNRNIVDLFLKTENSAIYVVHRIFGTDERTIIDALASTKYFVEKEGREQYVPYGYSLLERTDEGTLIYENRYALPWGYTYDSYLLDSELEGRNGIEIEEAMLQHVVLEDRVNGIPAGSLASHIQTLSYEIEDMDGVEWDDGVLTVKEDDGTISLRSHLPPGAEGYLRLQGFDISDSGRSDLDVTVECGGVKKCAKALSNTFTWYFGREHYLTALGYSDEERTACTIAFPKKGTYRLEDIQLFALPMDEYPQQVEALQAEPLEDIEWGTNRMSGTVDLSKDKILCVSIPYSKGWTAKVDGKKTEILRGNYMFMALPLSEGRHEIEFTYCTPGLKAGIAFSLLSLTIVIVSAVRDRKSRGVDRG